MKPHLKLIQFIGLIVPRRLRADWRQEWEAELRYRELLLADWDKLDWRYKLDLCESGVEIAGKQVKRVELLCENDTPTH